jgi:hypothetical protein
LTARVLVPAALVYVPQTIEKVSQVENSLNYLAIHLSLAGADVVSGEGFAEKRSSGLLRKPWTT